MITSLKRQTVKTVNSDIHQQLNIQKIFNSKEFNKGSVF